MCKLRPEVSPEPNAASVACAGSLRATTGNTWKHLWRGLESKALVGSPVDERCLRRTHNLQPVYARMSGLRNVPERGTLLVALGREGIAPANDQPARQCD